jgi:hypothetical protein
MTRCHLNLDQVFRVKLTIDIKEIIGYYKLMEMIVDASAIMAVITQEPERDTVIQLTKGAKILSPAMVSYEIANGLYNFCL